MYFLIIVAAIAVYVIMTRNKFNELQQMIKTEYLMLEYRVKHWTELWIN